MSTLDTQDTSNRYENERLILNILKEYYPELDVGPGTPFYEQVIRPSAFLWSKHSDGIKELLTSNSLAAPEAMTTSDLDRLMTRHFELRKTGQLVYGTCRIVFNTKKNYYIAGGSSFTATNDRVYKAADDVYLNKDQLTGDDTNGYPVDIEVVSEDVGNKYNAKLNETLQPPTELNPYIMKCFFATDTTDGGIQENNTAFYNRVAGNVSLKNLTTYRGVRALLLKTFNLKDVLVVGLRDPEMRRDIFELPSETGVFSVHRGGMSDFYVKNTPYLVVTGYQAPLGFPYSLNGISVADDPEGLMSTWNSLGLYGVNTNLRGSIYEVLPLSTTTKMTSLTSSIKEVQDFVSDMNYEAIHTDNIVKQMWPLVVCISMKISDSTGAAAIDVAKTAIVDHINNLGTGYYPQVGNIISAVKQAGVNYVHTPITMNAYYIKENLVMERIGLNKDHYPEDSLLVPLEDDSLMFDVKMKTQISIRTCFFYTNKDLIKIEVV